jgi:hypothetical protein
VRRPQPALPPEAARRGSRKGLAHNRVRFSGASVVAIPRPGDVRPAPGGARRQGSERIEHLEGHLDEVLAPRHGRVEEQLERPTPHPEVGQPRRRQSGTQVGGQLVVVEGGHGQVVGDEKTLLLPGLLGSKGDAVVAARLGQSDLVTAVSADSCAV